jgi:hypothetical protein
MKKARFPLFVIVSIAFAWVLFFRVTSPVSSSPLLGLTLTPTVPTATNTPVTPTNTPVTPTNTPVTPTNTPVTPTLTLVVSRTPSGPTATFTPTSPTDPTQTITPFIPTLPPPQTTQTLPILIPVTGVDQTFHPDMLINFGLIALAGVLILVGTSIWKNK